MKINLLYNKLKRKYFTKIKFIIIILFYFSIEFLIINCNNYKKYNDNNTKLMFYENNIDFSSYSTDIKAIAIYLPNLKYINKSYFYSYKYCDILNILQNVNPGIKVIINLECHIKNI